MKTLPKGPFLGINNRRPDFALHVPKEGDFVRDAVNVDVDGVGTLRRRQASALVQVMVTPHSLYMTSDNGGYLVRASAIYAFTLAPYSEVLFKVLSSNSRLFWQEFNGDLYYSNGTDSGRITSGIWFPIGLPTPASPTVSALPGGSLYHGHYQLATSYYNSVTGEEGGISASCNFQLASDGGIRVPLPGATPGATHVNIYCSTVNGSIPMLAATVAVGTATYDVIAPGTGREANQRYEEPLPPGALFWFNGCLCSYNGKNVYEGLPFRPGYYLPAEGAIPFPTNVTNCIPAQNGIFITTEDKSHWIPGTRITTAEDTLQDVLPYGAVPYTGFESPNKSLYGWFGNEGIVLAKPNGEVEALMSDNIKLTPPVAGSSLVIETQEYRRVVSCGWCMNLDNYAATRYDGYDFTSMHRGYGTKADGLYSLEGGGEAPLAWSISLGKERFGREERKYVPAIYLGASSARPLSMRIKTPKHDFAYTARSADDDLRLQRIDPGKGLVANWHEFFLSEEVYFTLASISFGSGASTRRI